MSGCHELQCKTTHTQPSVHLPPSSHFSTPVSPILHLILSSHPTPHSHPPPSLSLPPPHSHPTLPFGPSSADSCTVSLPPRSSKHSTDAGSQEQLASFVQTGLKAKPDTGPSWPDRICKQTCQLLTHNLRSTYLLPHTSQPQSLPSLTLNFPHPTQPPSTLTLTPTPHSHPTPLTLIPPLAFTPPPSISLPPPHSQPTLPLGPPSADTHTHTHTRTRARTHKQ